MKKPSMVDGWKQSFRWASVQCMTGALTLQAAWLGIPEDMRQALPTHLVSITTTILLFLGIAGRLIKQKPRKKKS